MSTSKDTTIEAETPAGVVPPEGVLAAAAGQLVEQAKATDVALTGDGGPVDRVGAPGVGLSG